MPWFSCSSAPTVEPGPLTRLKTPRGRPAMSASSASLTPHSGASRRGLVDDRVAGHERAPGGTSGERHGEVEWADHSPDAVRLQHRPSVDGRIAKVAHGVVEAVVLLQLIAVVADQVGGLLHVAQRLEPVLAHLDRHQRRELHLPLADQIRHAAHDRDALQPGRSCPAGRRGSSCRDRVAHVLASALCELAHERAIDRRELLEVGLRRPPLTVDELPVRLPELAAGNQKPGVVVGVELLVVVAQRGVGDLEPGLGRRGHAERLLVRAPKTGPHRLEYAARSRVQPC